MPLVAINPLDTVTFVLVSAVDKACALFVPKVSLNGTFLANVTCD